MQEKQFLEIEAEAQRNKICFFVSAVVSICGAALIALAIFKDASAMTKIIVALIGIALGLLFSVAPMSKKHIFSVADSNDLPRWKKFLQKIHLFFN